MYKINESQISRLKGKTCVQKPLLPDESSCEASGQAILRLAQNMTESFLLLLERLLGNAVLRRRAWPQWEMPRDCSRWKVAPKAQPVSMLFTFFESCWGGKKKKSSHLHQFSALANMTQAEYLQRSSTWPNQGKIWGSLSWEASHYPQWNSFPPAVAYTCQSDLWKFWPRKGSHPDLLDRGFWILSLPQNWIHEELGIALEVAKNIPNFSIHTLHK